MGDDSFYKADLRCEYYDVRLPPSGRSQPRVLTDPSIFCAAKDYYYDAIAYVVDSLSLLSRITLRVVWERNGSILNIFLMSLTRIYCNYFR